MRKLLIGALTVGLVAGALVVPATAAKKAKPQPVTFYFHGPLPLGELDYVETTANTAQSIPDGFQVMDTTEASDPAPDSQALLNYVRGPNTTCNGNALFPTWQGQVTGKISGDMTVYVSAIAGPATNVTVDVFADTSGGCESVTGSTGYIDPVATTQVTLTPGPGETEVVFKSVNFKAMSHMVVMITPVSLPPVADQPVLDPASQGRILYDSADYASRIEFTCTPTSGKSCLPAS
jgi:hypothetical protein